MLWHEKLKFARQIKRISLRELSEVTGISNAYLCQLENGQIKDPSFFKMAKLIKYFNLNPSDLLEEEQS